MSPISRGISPDQSFVPCVYRLLDTAAVGLVLALALRWTPQATVEQMITIAAAAVVAHYVAAELSGLYRSWRGASVGGELRCVMLSWGYTAITLLGIGLVTSVNAQFTYESKLTWIFGTPVAMGVARYVVRTILHGLRARGFNSHTFAVCGVNELGLQLVHNIERTPEMGLRFVGFFDDRPNERTSSSSNLGRRLGGLDELVERARRGSIDRIYITFPMRAEQRIRNVLERLGDSTASVYIVPDFFVFELLSARWTNINGLPTVSVFENPLYGVDGLLKRIADVVLGSLILAVAAVPMFLIAILVKLSSPGPVFFRQKRYGLDGREILVWKFRSMNCCDNSSIVKQASKNDQRVTPLGHVIRRTSLDELPQLFNVLEGTMSLVGPRPHANAHNEQYRSLIDGYMLRHKVKPGITGLAQVSGFRGETETLEKMQQRIKCDHQYIREWSLWMDLKILCRTAFVVLGQQNAY
jgi:putative colanic acid biosysnthesis UDP-glucose lipid carrier transferase